MPTNEIDPLYGWHDIEAQTLTLRGSTPRNGVDAASITFVARSVLSRPDRMHTPDSIGLDITIEIPHPYAPEPVQHQRALGDYATLRTQRNQLTAFRDSMVDEVDLSMEGLDLKLYRHTWGARAGVVVEGVTSSVMNQEHWPWKTRAHKIGDWLLDDNTSAYCLRFAFLTSFADPPHIENFIRDIDTLNSHLQLYSNL